ncbi:MAG: hypothetical protein SOU02_05545 [Caecibacter massiliensis]|nr:hypothetical protein [Caecibacter massiliensis]
MENKRDKFIRLAEARTNKILNMIQLLGNCSNTQAYEYTSDDVDAIFSAIEKELKITRRKFSENGEKEEKVFKLKR